jgi:TMEM175 potassium channel family protein
VNRDTGRLVAFSDAVFAITITLLVLEIRPPSDYTSLLHGLAALWPSYLAYAVTFLFIGQVWANHHVMFDHIRAADRVVLLLNTLLLMVVAFLRSPPPSSPGRSAASTASEPPSSSTPSRST